MNVYLKSLLFLVFFSIFHFGYELTKWQFLKPFCGVNESVFQHLKMGFWSYSLLSVIEYFFQSKKVKNKIVNFWYSRILSILIIPWILTIIWYLLPALYGRAKSLIIDLPWAVITTYVSGLFVMQIEKEIEKVRFRVITKVIVLLLLVISAFLFIWFTYRLPWIDLFVDPEKL